MLWVGRLALDSVAKSVDLLDQKLAVLLVVLMVVKLAGRMGMKMVEM